MFRLRDLREDNNKSQKEIAALLGIQQNSYYENYSYLLSKWREIAGTLYILFRHFTTCYIYYLDFYYEFQYI